MLKIHLPGRSQLPDIEAFIHSQKTLKILKSSEEERESLQPNLHTQFTNADLIFISDIGGLKNES